MEMNNSLRYGAKFIDRTVLSIATTLPEIAIVIYAAAIGNYDIALGAGLGITYGDSISNLLCDRICFSMFQSSLSLTYQKIFDLLLLLDCILIA
jgi:uncharacterized membrane protein